MATRLDAILGVTYQGHAAFQKYNNDLSSIERKAGQGASSFATSFGKIAVAAGAVGVALAVVERGAQAVWDTMNEGADLLLVEDRFGRLAQQIGTTAEALNSQLAQATNGLLTTGEQMKLATDLMSLGLANSTEEVLRLSAVSSELNFDLNELVLTLTNKTTRRFDQLGVRVEGFEEKLAALEEQGYSTDEAFKWAFIEQAEEQVERVGSVADTEKGRIELLKVMWQETTESFQASFAESAVGQLGEIGDAANDTTEDLALLGDVWGKIWGTITGTALKGLSLFVRGEIAKIDYAQYMWRQVNRDLGLGFYEDVPTEWQGYIGGSPGGAAVGYEQAQAAKAQAAEAEKLAKAEQELNMQTGYMISGFTEAHDVQRGMNDLARVTELQLDALGDETEETGSRFYGMAEAVNTTEDAMLSLGSATGSLFASLRSGDFDLAERTFDILAKAGYNAAELAQFGVTAGLFDQSKANEMLMQTYLLQSAEAMAQSNLPVDQLWGSLLGMEQGGEGLAQEFFANLEKQEVELGLDTQRMTDEANTWVNEMNANLIIEPQIKMPSVAAIEELVVKGD